MNVRQSAPTNDLLSAHFSEAFPLKIQDYFSSFFWLGNLCKWLVCNKKDK